MRRRIIARAVKRNSLWPRLLLSFAMVTTFIVFSADYSAAGPAADQGVAWTDILVGTALFSFSTALILWAGDIYQRVLKD
ncbi:hypothetical protein [Emcibacter sp.]|uniref:hypothetical protein n=1 Tax=Emcibacter sp. TaxID=1979954 RepID=UPI002AA8EADF|nr:hypothetical protein [Emcibacter sp.]